MPATKSGASILIDSSPNTLSSITSDINDITWIEESPAGTFTVKAKQFVVRDGGVATIGNAGDFSVAEKLVMEPAGNDLCRVDIDRGGELQLFGASEIDANSMTPLYYQRWRWLGKFYCRGNATYTPYIYHLYLTWPQRYSFARDGFDRNHDVCDIDWLQVDTPWSSAAKWAQPSTYRLLADYGVEIIKNATFGKVGDPAWRVVETTQAQTRCVPDDGSKHIFEDCTFYGMGTAFYLNPLHYHIKNCLFDQSTSTAIICSQPFTTPGKFKSENSLYRDLNLQLMLFIEGCTFSPVFANDVQADFGGMLLVKDCVFNGTGNNVTAVNDGRVYIWSGNTFNGSVPVNVSTVNSSAQAFWVFSLDLTIEDDGGNPLEDAMIYIRQKDGKEDWLFRTDANGKPINMASLQGKIILVHKEQLDNVPNFTLWSDPSNSTYHDVWVWKEGYDWKKYQFEMTQDRVQTVQLADLTPAVGDVEKDVKYGNDTKTGTFAVPAVEIVKKGEQYGAGGTEFTGVLEIGAIIVSQNLTGRLQKKTNLKGRLRGG